MIEAEEYIEVLKEQLEEKSRLIQAMSTMIVEKDQEIILMKELLKDHPRGIDN